MFKLSKSTFADRYIFSIRWYLIGEMYSTSLKLFSIRWNLPEKCVQRVEKKIDAILLFRHLSTGWFQFVPTSRFDPLRLRLLAASTRCGFDSLRLRRFVYAPSFSGHFRYISLNLGVTYNLIGGCVCKSSKTQGVEDANRQRRKSSKTQRIESTCWNKFRDECYIRSKI